MNISTPYIFDLEGITCYKQLGDTIDIDCQLAAIHIQNILKKLAFDILNSNTKTLLYVVPFIEFDNDKYNIHKIWEYNSKFTTIVIIIAGKTIISGNTGTRKIKVMLNNDKSYNILRYLIYDYIITMLKGGCAI